MRVKICGITNVADALAAVEAGADTLGLNFVGGPRRISVDIAREILSVLPPMVTPVALVRVEASGLSPELVELLGVFRVAHLQVYPAAPSAPPPGPPLVRGGGASGAHGIAEVAGTHADSLPILSADLLTSLVAQGFQPWPVLAVKDSKFARQLSEWGRWSASLRPSAVVLDAYDPTRAGGTGQSFCWDWVVEARRVGASDWPPIMLAGGLHPDNVAEAVRTVRPYGVDVSSGVEVAGSPGRKDADRMMAFVRNARAASNTL